MKFHSFVTNWEECADVRPDVRAMFSNPSQYYAWLINAHQSVQIAFSESVCGSQSAWVAGFELERFWYARSRPYYKVWPSFAEVLGKVKLDVRLSGAAISERIIAIRFPVGEEPNVGQCRLCSILTMVQVEPQAGPLIVFTGQYLDSDGELRESDAIAVGGGEETIQERIDRVRYVSFGPGVSGDLVLQSIARFSFSVHLLADDPSLVVPDVLATDRRRFDESTDPELRQRLIDKARRRGISGWRIGEEYEVCPHYRRPHFALRHTGKGRTVPRIVAVKGSVVHRQKVVQVPTGHVTPEGMEIEL